jgi:hypothetical protein
MLAVTPDRLDDMVKRAVGDEQFPILHEPVEGFTDWPRVPDLTLAGHVRLIRFDDPSTGDGTVPVAFTAQEGRLLQVLRSTFGKGGLPIELVEDEVRSVPAATALSPRFDGKMCRARSTTDVAVGAIAVRRTMRPGENGTKEVSERVLLFDCKGNVIESADLAPTFANGNGSMSHEQAQAFERALTDALTSLSGPGTRLANFALDGMPFGDGEFRGFYVVRSDGTHAWIRAGWSGTGFERAQLPSEIEVTSVDGHSGSIDTLTTAELRQLIAAAGPAGVAIVSPSTAAPPRLRTEDHCSALWRRQLMTHGGVFTFDRREKVNTL